MSVVVPSGASPFCVDKDTRRSFGYRFIGVDPLGDGKVGARGTSNDPRPENVCPLARSPNTPDIPVDVFGRGSRGLPLAFLLIGDLGFEWAVARIRSDST